MLLYTNKLLACKKDELTLVSQSILSLMVMSTL